MIKDKLKTELSLSYLREELGVGFEKTSRKKAVEFMDAYKADTHSGDCTHKCWTCMRCICERALEFADDIMSSLEEGKAFDAE